jgi:leucyl aminopeptidase (aminopeptidase T)
MSSEFVKNLEKYAEVIIKVGLNLQPGRSGIKDGETLSDEELLAKGCNISEIHVDFMIGSGEMDVDGINENGKSEPIMRKGEWAFNI